VIYGVLIYTPVFTNINLNIVSKSTLQTAVSAPAQSRLVLASVVSTNMLWRVERHLSNLASAPLPEAKTLILSEPTLPTNEELSRVLLLVTGHISHVLATDPFSYVLFR
jgi:hypothetical protein